MLPKSYLQQQHENIKASNRSTEIDQTQRNHNPLQIKTERHHKLKRDKCVVCGAKRADVKSYVYYASGRTRLDAPFCQQHIENLEEYASPVFENQAALELFKKMFPQTYWQDVSGKTILFFDTYRREKTN